MNVKHFLQTLAGSMESNTTLKECDLNDNLIGDLGGQVRRWISHHPLASLTALHSMLCR